MRRSKARNRVRLPNQAGASATYYGDSYDAGTEINTEDLADIVPPCQSLIGIVDDHGSGGTGTTNPLLAEGGVVHHHLGIKGIADLVPAVHGWTGPTSMIEITRLD